MEIVEVCRLKKGDVIRDLRKNDMLNTRHCVTVGSVSRRDRLGSSRAGKYFLDCEFKRPRGEDTYLSGIGYILSARYKVVRVRSANP